MRNKYILYQKKQLNTSRNKSMELVPIVKETHGKLKIKNLK